MDFQKFPKWRHLGLSQSKKNTFTMCKFSSKVNGANYWGQDSVPAVTSLGSRLSWNLKPQWSSLLWRLQHYLHITRGDFSFSQTVMKFNPKYFFYMWFLKCAAPAKIKELNGVDCGAAQCSTHGLIVVLAGFASFIFSVGKKWESCQPLRPIMTPPSLPQKYFK